MEALRRQGERNDLTLGRDVPKWSHDEIGEESGLSGRQVKRYIRLTELTPELIDYVDKKKIQFMIAVDISYLDKDNYLYLNDNDFYLTLSVLNN